MNTSIIPSFYNELKKDELKTKITAMRMATFNTIYSDKLLTSRFTQIHQIPNVVSPEVCELFIDGSEKFASKARGWLFNKAHNYGVKEIPLNTVEIVFPYIKNMVFRVIIPFIEEKYEIMNWSLDIADGSILKFEESQKPEDFDVHRNSGEFTFIIPLEKSNNGLEFVNGAENRIVFNKIGEMIIFNSRTNKKFFGVGENSRFIMGCVKFMNGYRCIADHNVHPNGGLPLAVGSCQRA